MQSINAQQYLLASVRVGTVNSPRPFFKQGAYTESDNALRKNRVWLVLVLLLL